MNPRGYLQPLPASDPRAGGAHRTPVPGATEAGDRCSRASVLAEEDRQGAGSGRGVCPGVLGGAEGPLRADTRRREGDRGGLRPPVLGAPARESLGRTVDLSPPATGHG